MHQSYLLLAALSSLCQCAVSRSQDVVSTLSFGQNDRISPNGRAIPEWHLSGDNHVPQILSDRVILTPPAPGHARGALWADAPNLENQWTAEATFRVGGQDRGSGNFQIWYVKDGGPTIGSHSVYTVPTFDGLVLAIDQHGGRGGMLRGFLNDGSTNYKDHHFVDSLAFAHCDFQYRNLGHSSTVQIVHDSQGLKVNIDGQHCFSSGQISLPTGYHFGMTAATADNPDSFEVNSFIVTKMTSTTHGSPHQQPRSEQHDPNNAHRMPNAPEQIPDRDANLIQKQEEQFADLHNRLQTLSHQINSMYGEFEHIAYKIEERHGEVMSKLPKSSEDSIMSLSRRMEGLERILRNIEKDLSGKDYSGHLNDLRNAVEGVKGAHQDLPDTLHHIVKGSAPKLTTFVLAIIAVQIMLFGVYVVYKKRRDNAPKKYL